MQRRIVSATESKQHQGQRVKNSDPTIPKIDDGKRERNPFLWTIFGTILGLVLLYASSRKVDATTLVTTLRSADLRWALGILIAAVSFTALKAWRWRMLLRFVPGLKFNKLHSAVYAGLAVNFLVAHVGEFLRAAVIARASRVPVSAVFATVVVERALDFIAFLVLLTLLLLIGPDLPKFIEVAGAITGGIVVVAVAGLYMLLHSPNWLERLIAIVSRPMPEGLRKWCLLQIQRSRIGLAAIKDPQLMIVAVVVSVLQWSFVIIAICCSGLAVGETVTLVAAAATFVLIIVGLTLPNSPMQIGTLQLAFTIGLGTGGIVATAAVAASVIYTVFLIMPVMIVGGACLLRGRLLETLK